MGAIVLAVIALICFIISFLQFTEKGFLLNNAYIYASEEERKKLNKKPYYRQSGTIFMLIGLIFGLNSMAFLLHVRWLLLVVMAILMFTVVYALVSDSMIEKKH